jgi:ribonuclease P protein component
MIDKEHRFQGRGSLRFVYQRGQTSRGPLCALKYARNSRRSTFRVAVVVSRKVHKSAVVRNRIRRRIYEVVRLLAPSIKEAYDLIFIVYSDQVGLLSPEQLQTAVAEKLTKAGIIENNPTAVGVTRAIVSEKEK